jgi:hypothetical protein
VFENLQVSLGETKDSFWATDGNSSAWKNIPVKLGNKLTSMRKSGGGWTMTPTLVSLGVGEDFVLLSKSDTSIEIFWNLDTCPELEGVIKVILENKRLNELRVSD